MFIYSKNPKHKTMIFSVSGKALFMRRLSPQFLKIMKLTAVLLTITFLQVSAKSFPQVTLSLKNAPMEKVFFEIERQAGFGFLYTKAMLSGLPNVTIKVKNASVNEVLNECFKGQPMVYSIENNTIVVTRKAAADPDRTADPESIPPPVEIRGRVRSSGGEPLQNVSVTVVGSQMGTTTNNEGHFTLTAPDNKNIVLEFSSVGYETQRVNIGNQTEVNVVLELDIAGLNDIVVVGYGTQKRTSLSSAVVDIKGDDLNRRTVADVTQSLQGLAPGVTITDGGGGPGKSDVTIRVRGITNLSGNDPLIIVDGIEQPLKDIDPADIERVTVLKDAASTSIYGSRAANGVLLVTTKRAKAGKLSVNLHSYYAVQNVIFHPKQMGMEDYMRLQNVAYTNAGSPAPFTEEDIQTWLTTTDRVKYPLVNDWINVMFSPAPQHNQTLSVSGGTDKIKALLSVNYLDQDGVIPNSGSRRKSMRFNTDFKVSKKITLSGDFNYRLKDYHSPTNETTSIKYIWASSNFAVPRYPDGTYGMSSDGISPLVEAELKGVSNFKDNFGAANMKADIELFSGLKFQSQYGITFGGLSQKIFSNAFEIRDYYNKDVIRQQVTTNSLTEIRDYYEQSTLNNMLTYDLLKGNHTISALLGYSQIKYEYNTLSASRKDFYNNEVQSISQGSLGSRANEGYDSEWGLRSYFGRLNYNFSEKYFVELNARYDGSSRFTGSNRYSFFPSFSGAWRISKEKFWEPLSNVANELKIRGSWGKTGNQSVGLYAYLETLSALDYNFGGQPVQGLYQSTLANQALTWETTIQSNVGADASFLNGKLGVSFDYYNKLTEGILLSLPIPLTVGLNPPPQNAGSVENKGWELAISYHAAIKDFNYNLAFNISNVHNRITSLAGTGPYINNEHWVTTIQKEGLPISSYYGYRALGFFQTEEEINNYPTLFPGIKPGDLKYEDVNKDGILSASDMVEIGSNIPHYTFGLNMNFDYKNFDMNLFFQGVGKAQAMIGEWAGNVPWQSFTMDFQKDYWTPENRNAKYPRPEAFADNNWVNADFWIVNSAYLKLKNVQLGYTLPTGIADKINISRLRVYVAAANVFTISKVNKWGFDPEFNTSLRTYPQLSSYTFGINLTF
jgi:TonB-linked SusC/RagA family outer membrane protein